MTRVTIADYGIDPNPLSVHWHWEFDDDTIDLDATYEPAEGRGIAMFIPDVSKRIVNQDGPDQWTRVPDPNRSEFMAVALDDELADGWILMQNGDAESVVFQGGMDIAPSQTTPLHIIGPRRPDAVCVARFLAVDNDIRHSA